MNTSDFYNIIDNELDVLLEKYKDDAFLEKHKKNSNNQKSYAFLIWFLGFYGKQSNYANYITEGSDDSSCDVILDRKDNQGKRVFYLVQSKWNNARKANAEVDRDEILKALSDFETLVSGEQKKVNTKLKTELARLSEHLKDNGEVKFIFLSLAQYKGGADDNIRTFLKKDDKRSAEIIDINRIKNDYIDRNYKKITPINPLEPKYTPQESTVSIAIAESSNFVKINNPFPAYSILLRPKMIYELFDKYGFALFYKNVRNPLLESQFNEQIEQTVIDNPAFFWYYNNGITAITSILPTIGQQAETIQVRGLQVINGAQTIYAVYRAYKNASTLERDKMDAEALISLRLLSSGGKDFDINVTRYTNSQNPVSDRDFFANDDIQIALQNASYNTPIWYQKRRGEFRELPEGIRGVSNEIFADLYMAFHLQDAESLIKKRAYKDVRNKNLSFISHNGNGTKYGLYEKIFNDNTSFEDMLSAYYVADTILTKVEKNIDEVSLTFFFWLEISKVILTEYLQVKFDDKINVSRQIIQNYEKGEKDFIIRVFGWMLDISLKTLFDKKTTGQESSETIDDTSFFNAMKERFEEVTEVNYIENMPLDKAIESIKMMGSEI